MCFTETVINSRMNYLEMKSLIRILRNFKDLCFKRDSRKLSLGNEKGENENNFMESGKKIR